MTAALIFVALLALMVLFQLALAFGAPFGHFAWGGRYRVLPRRLRIGSLVALPIYAIIAVIVLDRAELIDMLPGSVSTVGTWIVFAYLLLSAGLNAISPSKHERYAAGALSLVLATLCLIIAL